MPSIPESTTVLIVGAGPAGMACAISLFEQGCRDIVIVDAVLQGENASRAILIHAATTEALDTIGCAQPMVDRGIKGQSMVVHNRSGPLITADFASLAPHTRFPFALIIPQPDTERVLGERVQSLGVPIFRPYRVTSIKGNDRNNYSVEVGFESGEVIRTKYIVGADGARSVIRQIAGINFADPDGLKENDPTTLSQMVLADVAFKDASEFRLPKQGMMSVASSNNFFILMPMPPCSTSSQTQMYRIGCGVPLGSGSPGHAPSTSYLQDLLNKYGPLVNSRPLQISETAWSTRFRTRSAAADRVFVRFDGQNITGTKQDANGAVIVLIGDAAHIHSPAGGQGMNLGLRDAVTLGPVLADHVKRSQLSSTAEADHIIQEYASVRHARALTVIRLTKNILNVAGGSIMPQSVTKYMWWFPIRATTVRDWTLRLLGHFSVVRGIVAWRLSGLGTR